MSQINTTANKFDYSKVNLTDPADGINLFGSPLSKIIEYDVTTQSAEYGELVLSPPKDISKKLTSSIQLYHIRGCIHKDILFEQITYYNGTAYDVCTVLQAGFFIDNDGHNNNITCFYYIPIDPHTSDDYFDIYFYLSQPEISKFIIISNMWEQGRVRSNWTVDAHVSIYQVA